MIAALVIATILMLLGGEGIALLIVIGVLFAMVSA
jgi:hypothetical protein